MCVWQTMNPLRVVIFFHNSLFAAGIASRLEEAGFSDVSLLDVNQFDATKIIQTVQPDIIIFDSSDLGVTENICFFSILQDLPGVQIMQVDYAREKVQIYCSRLKDAHEMSEFITLMQNITVPME